ncbi:hypothetical protein A2U01_0116454, partial [Trifolium medium]|nr:hypothetical protein [Trifolium medium]
GPPLFIGDSPDKNKLGLTCYRFCSS